MKRQDDEPALGPSKPSRTEEARRIVEEYADDLREILKKFRRPTSLTSSFQFEPSHDGRVLRADIGFGGGNISQATFQVHHCHGIQRLP
jgi:hypothetical protein